MSGKVIYVDVWNGYFLADPDFKIYPPKPDFLDQMVFYISFFQLKKAFVRTWKILNVKLKHSETILDL